MSVKKNLLAVSRGAILAVSLALLGSGASVAMAGGPVFDQDTVAKRWNFRFSGQGKDGSAYAVVGWFEANEAGAIVDGRADSTISGNAVSHRSHQLLSTAGQNTITLK